MPEEAAEKWLKMIGINAKGPTVQGFDFFQKYFFQAVFILLAVIVITIGTLRASVKLHRELLEKILSSTMAFFDTTPVGRIINRFSKDIDEIDLQIPTHIKDILSDLFSVLGTLFVVCYATPIIIAVVIPLIIVFFFIQSTYLATSRYIFCNITVVWNVFRKKVEAFFDELALIFDKNTPIANHCFSIMKNIRSYRT